MTALVQGAEASFLLLTARRVLNFQKKAEAQGETYHDLQPMVDLQCGYAAKMRFEKGPSGEYRSLVIVGPASVHHAVAYSPDGCQQVASEILGGPAVAVPDLFIGKQTFCLEKDK